MASSAAATAASTAPAETIAALSQVMHIGTVVDVCIDRPSTHYDGGAWIDRCQALSWYTEALGGDRWLPAQATIAAAWTAAGSAVGAVFQASATAGPLTSGKFYTATSATTATEVWRGIKREYPRAGVAKVVESARLVEYDIGTGAMWRVSPVTAGYSLHSGTITSVSAVNDLTVIGMSTQAIELDYAAGTVRKRSATDYTSNSLGFGSQVTAGTWNVINATAVLVNSAVNDVAITTLENSQIDPATGLPAVTIAIATAGGVSVILDTGVVVNSAVTIANGCYIDKNNVLWSQNNNVYSLRHGYIGALGAAFGYDANLATSQYSATNIPSGTIIGTKTAVNNSSGGSAGLHVLKGAGTISKNYLHAEITQSYATGYMPGDIRLATICAADGVTESVVGGTIPDRSVKNVSLNVNGTLTKTPVAAGAALCALSGFSAANYLEQPYNSQLDFGTGDFCVMGWVYFSSLSSRQSIFFRGQSNRTTPYFFLETASTAKLIGRVLSSTGNNSEVTTTGTVQTGAWQLLVFAFSGTTKVLTVGINSLGSPSDNTITGTVGSVSNLTALMRFGEDKSVSAPLSTGSLALWRISATAPSADQIAQIYRDELPLFSPGAQCTLAGTSPAVTALAYDDTTDILHVGTSYGRSSFKSLLRVESEATTVGAPTALAASGGTVIMAGTSAKVYVPAKYLRDELQRREEAKKALGRIPVFFDHTATSGQTAFVAPKGFTIKGLYKAGVLMRETTTGVYWQRSNDGYQETATISVGATTGDWISLMCVRV